jgi:N-acetylmuramic acid 6-phosphate etherase
MQKGGRLFYVGAGTSGRLGILDAVECKPTFSVSPERVIGILAGGEKAMFRSQEDIEDNAELGAEKIRSYEISPNDCVVGIAASGKTPFVIGAVEAARKEGAFTAALVCNQDSALAAAAEMGMAVIVGPEVVTGSTRMKAGTAQKMILNMISTTVMIKQGKVYSNLMVDLQPTNDKLRSRAQNIFKIITAAEDQIAAEYLKRANYELKEAVIMYEKGVELKEAQKLLAENDGVLKKVIN